MSRAARFGLLPRVGDGHQVMSWISHTDEIRAIRFLLDGPAADERAGPYNLTAPNAVTDGELTAALLAWRSGTRTSAGSASPPHC